MKNVISKKLALKKVTVSIYNIQGAGNTGTPPSQANDTTDETLSSAYNDPTENPINPLYLSFDAGICA